MTDVEYTLHDVRGNFVGIRGTLEKVRQEAERFGSAMQIRKNMQCIVEWHTPQSCAEDADGQR